MDISQGDVQCWFTSLRATPATANRALPVLSGILQDAENIGLRTKNSNPCNGIRRYRLPVRNRFLTRKELMRLGEVLGMWHESAFSIVALVYLLILTGCRQSEIRCLRWLEYREGNIHLSDSKTGPKTIWLSSPARTLLDDLPRVSKWVFPAVRDKGPMRTETLYRHWREIRTAADLAGVRLHDLRHTYASFALRQNETLLTIGRLLGHQDPSSTLRYLHIDENVARSAVQNVSDSMSSSHLMTSFAEFVKGSWARQCFDQYKLTTQRRVESILRTQLLPTFGQSQLINITFLQVQRWFIGYSRHAPSGANRALDTLTQIFNYAISLGVIQENAAQGIHRNPRRKLTRFLSVEEVERMYETLDEHRARGGLTQQADIIRLLSLTGCRKGELIQLKWSEVDEDRLILRDGKSGPRTVYLCTRAQALISRQPRISAFVFPDHRNITECRSMELSLWRKVRKCANLEDVRLHDLRHTFASQAVIAGVPLAVVSRLLGHSQMRMTLRYAHVGDRESEAAAERIGLAISELVNVNLRTSSSTRSESKSNRVDSLGSIQ